ncbi:MAG: nickel pincer cofactor biosynthesis protein LarC [Planctomycetaceae bacterium]|nr:nickel pincer cofactor biosynthesis protein LarC [Planctomycetaceae bacterium]
MRIAYLDCASGISGDMTLGALIDAGADRQVIAAGIDSLGLPCRLAIADVKKKGFRATHVTVEHEPQHAHRHLHHIVDLIDKSQITATQKDLAKRIFQKLAEAEAKVHGSTIQKVHFHEVGAIDSIADIVGAAIGWDLLGVERIECSPIPTGRGTIEIAHGKCTIPAPATGELLKGIPLAPSEIECELTTPTGAAIVATLAHGFGPLPAMTVERIGYGAGTRDLVEQANLLRLFVGEQSTPASSDQVWVLETNLDDLSGELVGYTTGRLWEAGALDVYSTAIQMKKNRPGIKLTVLCQAADVETVERVLFRETTTLGVRRWPASRHKLERKPHQVTTPLGVVAGKLGWIAGEAPKFSPEFESCSRVAAEKNVPLAEVYAAAHQAFAAESRRS